MATKLMHLSGYEISEKLHVGTRTVIYRAHRIADQEPVILKMLKKNYPSTEDITTLKHEYHLLKDINIPGVIEVCDLITYQNRSALVMKDVKGKTLESFLRKGPINLNLFFNVALSLIDTLKELHRHHIIHKDIKPANVIINIKAEKVYLIDFSIASILLDRVSSNSDINRLEGTLAYMAPEQTGRMNISLDQRTDLYSLGVLFYECLTGEKPFVTDDSLEMVYAHLAKPPTPLNMLNKDIPEQLSNIVLKLLAKEPNERYGSAVGLKNDIAECAIQWRDSKHITPFALGKFDDQSELKISQKLYGRQEQIDQLLSLFNNVHDTASKSSILISGEAGVGKSVLVQTLQKPIMGSNGYFISGKYEQLEKNIPYHAFVKAFKALILQIMSQSDETIVQLRERMLAALDNLGQVVIDIIPEVEWLIGKQPEVPKLSPVETKNRFMLVFQNFMQAIIQPNKPLVIFLDDLQWADSASFKLLEFILTDERIHNLFIIGAYRDNEIDEHHALTHFINSVEAKNIHLQQMHLEPLKSDDISQLLQDSLFVSTKEVEPLAKLLYSKTAGNPFFIKKYIQTLNSKELIAYDSFRLRWEWNIEAINELEIAGNVVSFMMKRIRDISSSAQETIGIAACIGNRFTLQMLSVICNKTLVSLCNDLIEAISAGLILPLDKAYKYTDLFAKPNTQIQEINNTDNITYQFIHDKVQEASYAFIDVDKQKRIHVKIGELLLEKGNKTTNADNLFEILGHFNQALTYITDAGQRMYLAHLNLVGGKRAKAASAHEAAIEYLDSGIKLIGKDGWIKNYTLMFSLYKELSQCRYFCAQFSEAENDFDLLLNEAKNEADKTNILDMKAELYSNLGRYEDAVHTLINAIQLLGVKVPKKVNFLHILWELIKIKFKLLGKKIENLDTKLAKVTAPKDILITNLFNHLIFPTYSSDPNLFALLMCKSVYFSLQRGYSKYSLETFLNFAIIFDSIFKRANSSRAFATLVNKLEKNFDDRQIYARDQITTAVFITPWYNSLRDALPPMKEGIVINKEVGDLHYVSGTSVVHGIYSFESGFELQEVLNEVSSSLNFLERFNSDFKFFNLFFKKLLEFLTAEEKDFSTVITELSKMKKLENDSTYFVALNYCSIALYLIGNYSEALQYANKASEHKLAAIGTFPAVSQELFYGLILAKLFDQSPKKMQVFYLKELHRILKNFSYLAKQCPQNFEHLSYLIQAEIFRIKQLNEKAAVYYDKAIKAAYAHNYLQYVAIANECAGAFYEKLDRDIVAHAYFQSAHHAYIRWGAFFKSLELEDRFPQLVQSEPFMAETWSKHVTKDLISISGSQSNQTMAALNLLSILKANRAISSEVTLPNVLRKLMEIVLENSGAQRTALINIRDKQFIVEAEGKLVKNKIEVNLDNSLLTNRSDFPILLLNYVAHSKQAVIFDQSSKPDQFSSDSYLLRKHVKSALCVPIHHKGRVRYLLYLENTLLAGTFTKEHADIISSLAAQAAISLENAHLYSTYEQFVPYQFLEQLNKQSITDVKLGDQVERTMTVLFCDIRKFSSMSESMSPSEIFDFINQFLSVMEPVIRKHQGFIDKYIGDAIMALFIDTDSALKAAVSITKKLIEFNKLRTKIHKAPIDIGVGIDTGKVMLGIIGSSDRIETSVLSDTVNNASNIQQLTREYNVRILLTTETKNALKNPENFSLRLVGKNKMKGKLHEVEIWELNTDSILSS